MGFLKKTAICEKCGKEYQKGILESLHICMDCVRLWRQKREPVIGYEEYANKVLDKYYTEEEWEQILDHKMQILEKYRQTNGISVVELEKASENYKNLTDEQAADILLRVALSSIESTCGAGYSGKFFIPTQYEGVVVDTEDVFAVGYTNALRVNDTKNEAILCAVFTNDPYVPVFSMIYAGKLGFFELMKSKKGRQNVAAVFESMCPNLTYPVQELKQLKKQIKSEGTIRGKIDMQFMLNQISDAEINAKMFDVRNIPVDMPQASVTMVEEYGYIQNAKINQILRMDKMFNRNFWNKQLQRLGKNDQ